MKNDWGHLNAWLAPGGVVDEPLLRRWLNETTTGQMLHDTSKALGHVLSYTPAHEGQYAFDTLMEYELETFGVGLWFNTVLECNSTALYDWLSSYLERYPRSEALTSISIRVPDMRWDNIQAPPLKEFNISGKWPKETNLPLLATGAHILNTCSSKKWLKIGNALFLEGTAWMTTCTEDFSWIAPYHALLSVERVVSVLEKNRQDRFGHCRWIADTICDPNAAESLKTFAETLIHTLLKKHANAWSFWDAPNGEMVGLMGVAHHTSNPDTRNMILDYIANSAGRGKHFKYGDDSEFEDALDALWAQQPSLGREFLERFSVSKYELALVTGTKPKKQFCGVPSTAVSTALFAEIPPEKSVPLLYEALAIEATSPAQIGALLKRLSPASWSLEQQKVIRDSGWPLHAALTYLFYLANKEVPFSKPWASMPEPLSMLATLYPDHKETWSQCWRACFMESNVGKEGLNASVVRVFDTILKTLTPSRELTFESMVNIVQSLDCTPLSFLQNSVLPDHSSATMRLPCLE